MRFWDSSAIVPLLLDEPDSGIVTDTLRDDGELVAWWGTSVECASAIRSRERDGDLSAPDASHALDLLATLETSWHEILPGNMVRSSAQRLLAVHPLRAADSLQLAAATVWRRDATSRLDFVSLDQQLADSAAREGFRALPGR